LARNRYGNEKTVVTLLPLYEMRESVVLMVI
jgi:hypothetical protein